jgi:diadenosine tetraphosphate (Ap4A) HIT family hydrolase
MEKFGYPATLVAETGFWAVLARPQQVTLGSLVLVCREPVTAFGQVSAAAFADLQAVIARTERMLTGFVSYQKINYLMLMMVDPDVHFHVIPRYEAQRTLEGTVYPDAGWPGPPALGQAVVPAAPALAALTELLRARWAQAAP